jgi:hypothetical protein
MTLAYIGLMNRLLGALADRNDQLCKIVTRMGASAQDRLKE